ncbi:MAG: 30S ribosomal protein S13 [Methanosarcinales archaeon]|nr:MAG: 30S ribosomal protein S13 [Methanosarcinales archaeon]
MPKKNEKTEEESIKHIVRIVNTDLKGKKSVCYALTGIKGISRRAARVITRKAGIDPNATMGHLSDEEIDKLKKAVDEFEKTAPIWMINRQKDNVTGGNRHVIGAKLMLQLREDLNRLKKIRSYRGIRHERGLKVRGQKTRSTGRRGAVVGVVRKRILAEKAEKK